jgi:hypothetical protein
MGAACPDWAPLLADLYEFCFSEIANHASMCLEVVYQILPVLLQKSCVTVPEHCLFETFENFRASESHSLHIRILNFFFILSRTDRLHPPETVVIVEFCAALLDAADHDLLSYAWPCLTELLKCDGIPEFVVTIGVGARAVELLRGSFAEKCRGAEFVSELMAVVRSEKSAAFAAEALPGVLEVLACLDPAFQGHVLERVQAMLGSGQMDGQLIVGPFMNYCEELEDGTDEERVIEIGAKIRAFLMGLNN